MSTTVVIPAYNTGEYLRETIASVIRQSVSKWSLKIVDDGSTDGTLALATEIAASDSRIEVLHKANGGMARSRNWGIEHADERSDAILFLDHDDVLKPDGLEVLRTVLERHPEAPAVHGTADFIGSDGSPQVRDFLDEVQVERFEVSADGRVRVSDPSEPTTFGVLAYRNCILTMGQVLIRRAALAEVGPFDPCAVPCDDYDLYLRLARIGPIARVAQAVVSWRDHGGNTSGDREQMWSADRWVRRHALESAPEGSLERSVVVRGWQAVCGRMVPLRFGWALQAARSGRPRLAALECARAMRDALRSRTTSWMHAPSRNDHS